MKLLHLADSALPIGSAAHSYGMETLVFDGDLTVEHLMDFFVAYVEEAGAVEADYCGKAYAIGADLVGVAEASVDAHDWTPWLRLNRQLSARELARESRSASAILRPAAHTPRPTRWNSIPDSMAHCVPSAMQIFTMPPLMGSLVDGGPWGAEETVLPSCNKSWLAWSRPANG